MATEVERSNEGLHSRLAIYSSQTTSFCFMRSKHLPRDWNVNPVRLNEGISHDMVGSMSINVRAADSNYPVYVSLSMLRERDEISGLCLSIRKHIYEFCCNVLRVLFCRGFYLYGSNLDQYFIVEVGQDFIEYRLCSEQLQRNRAAGAGNPELENRCAELRTNLVKKGLMQPENGQTGPENPTMPELQLYKPTLTQQVQNVSQLHNLIQCLGIEKTLSSGLNLPVDVELFRDEGGQIQQDSTKKSVSDFCKEIFQLDDVDFIDFGAKNTEEASQSLQKATPAISKMNLTRKYFFNETKVSNEQLLLQYMRALYQRQPECQNATPEEINQNMSAMQMTTEERRPVWILLGRIVLEREGVKDYRCVPDWLDDYVRYEKPKELPEEFMAMQSHESQTSALARLRIALGLYPDDQCLCQEYYFPNDVGDTYKFENPIDITQMPTWLRNKLFQFFSCLIEMRTANKKDKLDQKFVQLPGDMQFQEIYGILIVNKQPDNNTLKTLAFMI